MVIISDEEIHVTDAQVKKLFYICLVMLIIGTIFSGIYVPILFRDIETGDISFGPSTIYLIIGLSLEILGLMGTIVYIFKPELLRNMLVNREKQTRKRKEMKKK